MHLASANGTDVCFKHTNLRKPPTPIVLAGSEAIQAMHWVGPTLVWATGQYVKVHDTSVHLPVGTLNRARGSRHAEYPACALLLREDGALYAGWADCIKVGGR